MGDLQEETGRNVTKEERAIDKFAIEELVLHIDSFGRNLNSWEVDFISSLIDDPPETYTEKQKLVINRIYDMKC